MMKRRFMAPESRILLAAKTLVSIFVFSSFFASCKAKTTGSNVAYIIGASNDITPISDQNSGSVPTDIFNATGLIVTKLKGEKVKYCSGSLTAPESPGENLRVITNHHCFAQADDRGNASDLLLVEACTGTEIYLGFSPALGQAPQRGMCKPGSLRTNPAMDLAMFTLTKPLPEYNQPLEIWDGDPIPSGRPAMIVHYPDSDKNLAIPPGQRARLPTASITSQNCQVSTIFEQDEWELDRSLPYGMRHTCDLIHGSSGSPLIDLETKKVIGINWGGIKIKKEGVEIADNVATRAVFLKQFIAGEVYTSSSASNPALDAIAAQRAAATNPSKKPSGVPLGCGVASKSPAHPLLVFLMMTLPVSILVVQRRFVQVPMKTMSRPPHRYIGTLLVLLGILMHPGEARSDVSPIHLIIVAYSQEYLATTTELKAPAAELKAKACIAAAESDKRNLPLPMQSEFLARLQVVGIKAPDCITSSKFHFAEWNVLKNHFGAKDLKCEVLKSDIETFISLQSSIASSASNLVAEQLKVAEGMSENRLQCLLTALTGSSALANGDSRYDPLPLISTLQKRNHPLADISTLSGQRLLQIASTRHLQTSNYAEALRSLITLLDRAPEWRPIYESVQRIYNYRQKGKGSVALNQ